MPISITSLPAHPVETATATQTGSSRLHRIGRVIGLRIHFGDSAPKILDGASYFVVSVEHLAVATHVLGIDAHNVVVDKSHHR